MANPYQALPNMSFWRQAIADKNPLAISDLWQPKITLSRSDLVSTAGSCFAQHIGNALSAGGYQWFDAEPAPEIVPPELRKTYNYGIFSFRTGNIYTAALLRQWLSWAVGDTPPSPEIWEKKGRFYDPFRPVVEPDGFASPEELLASRQTTLSAIRTAITKSKVFVFTMGLTESWENVSGAVYPMCPGTSAGEFDASQHIFHNYDYVRVRSDLQAAIAIARRLNPELRILLTVSPVPLTATASDKHVLVATTYSKSTLRAVAGDLCAADEHIDYFPSYEIITGFPFRGFFFDPNLRNVAKEGVAFVMQSFFRGLKEDEAPLPEPPRQAAPRKMTDEELVCEEEILARF